MTEQTTTAEQLVEAEFDRDRYKADHLGACKTIADMHAAAVGEVTGPARGVVEDVEDVRKRAERAEAYLNGLRKLIADSRQADAKGITLDALGEYLDRPAPAPGTITTEG